MGTEDTKQEKAIASQGSAGRDHKFKCPNEQSRRAHHGSDSVLGGPSLVSSLHGGYKLGKRRLTLAGFALKRQHQCLHADLWEESAFTSRWLLNGTGLTVMPDAVCTTS